MIGRAGIKNPFFLSLCSVVPLPLRLLSAFRMLFCKSGVVTFRKLSVPDLLLWVAGGGHGFWAAVVLVCMALKSPSWILKNNYKNNADNIFSEY